MSCNTELFLAHPRSPAQPRRHTPDRCRCSIVNVRIRVRTLADIPGWPGYAYDAFLHCNECDWPKLAGLPISYSGEADMRYISAAFIGTVCAVIVFGDAMAERAAGNTRRFVCDARADGGVHAQPEGFGSPSATLEAAKQSALKACEFDSAPGLGSTCRLTCTPANTLP
jgi:hypothetical protein